MSELLDDRAAADLANLVMAALDDEERGIERRRTLVAEYRRARETHRPLTEQVRLGHNLTSAERAEWERQALVLEGLEFAVQLLAGDFKP